MHGGLLRIDLISLKKDQRAASCMFAWPHEKNATAFPGNRYCLERNMQKRVGYLRPASRQKKPVDQSLLTYLQPHDEIWENLAYLFSKQHMQSRDYPLGESYAPKSLRMFLCSVWRNPFT